MSQHARQPRGHSLTELVIVLGMVSFVVSTSTQLVHQVLRSSTVAQRDVDLQRVCQSAAIHLREDTRAATSAELLAPASKAEVTVRLKMRDNETIDYRACSQRLERTVVRDGHQVHVEEFSFGPRATVEWVHLAADRATTSSSRPGDTLPAGQVRLRVVRVTADGDLADTGEEPVRQCVLDLWTTLDRYHRLVLVTSPKVVSP